MKSGGLLLALFIVLPMFAWSEKASRKVIIVDMVSGQSKNFKVWCKWKMSDKPGLSHFEPDALELTEKSDDQRGLQFIVDIDSSIKNLYFSIDDSGSYIEIRNSFQIAYDTIRIARVHVFRHCLPDSVFTNIEWYRKYPERDSNQLRLLKKRHYTRAYPSACTTDPPTDYLISINYVNYLIPLSISRGPTTIYHGYKHRHQQRLNYAGKHYKYFVVYQRVNKHISSGTVDLNKH